MKRSIEYNAVQHRSLKAFQDDLLDPWGTRPVGAAWRRAIVPFLQGFDLGVTKLKSQTGSKNNKSKKKVKGAHGPSHGRGSRGPSWPVNYNVAGSPGSDVQGACMHHGGSTYPQTHSTIDGRSPEGTHANYRDAPINTARRSGGGPGAGVRTSSAKPSRRRALPRRVWRSRN